MTPTRYRECLDILGLSQRGLAPILRCSDRLTRSWATGRDVIPAEVADWLDAWVATRLAHPDPAPPDNWQGKRGLQAMGVESRTAGQPCEPALTSAHPGSSDGDVRSHGENLSAADRKVPEILEEIAKLLSQFAG
jgi:hypothetical protein